MKKLTESRILTEPQAARLRSLARLYKPKIGRSSRHRTPDQLWLRVLSQIVVAGNAAPAALLRDSIAVRQKLAFARLKRFSKRRRRKTIHSVLWAMGTRYVGENPSVPKIDAAVHNFNALVEAGGPQEFFKKVAALKGRRAKLDFLERNLQYYKKKGCRDTLIELRLAGDCMALDQRIKNILAGVGVNIRGSVDRRFEQIEKELIERVAKPSGLSGGELDRILFQNYGDIMVRLRCP